MVLVLVLLGFWRCPLELDMHVTDVSPSVHQSPTEDGTLDQLIHELRLPLSPASLPTVL